MRDTILLAAVQSAAVFILVWAVFRAVPTLSPSAKAWIWRLAFLKPLACLLPFAAVPLGLLPQASPVPEPLLAPLPARVRGVAERSAAHPQPTSDFDLVGSIWLIGVAGSLGAGAWRSARALRLLAHADPIKDPTLLEALEQLRKRAGLRRAIRLLSSEDVAGPMLVDGWRPRIVLPVSATEAGDAGDARLMLAHEVAHLVRRDVAWFGVMWLVQSLFFFNPAVWLASRYARLDHESATDRHARELADVSVQTYGAMLLRATVVARSPLVLGVLPMAESFRSIHQRLEAMKQFNNRPSFWRTSTLVALGLVTVGTLPLYRLAAASPGQDTPGKLLFTAAKSAKNPFKYSVYQDGKNLWIVIEKDGKKRQILWDERQVPNGPAELANRVFGSVDRSASDSKLLNCEFSNSDVREALRHLFRTKNVSFTIDPKVQGVVTLSCKNVSFDAVLKSMVRQVDAEVKIEDGVYNIVRMSP